MQPAILSYSRSLGLLVHVDFTNVFVFLVWFTWNRGESRALAHAQPRRDDRRPRVDELDEQLGGVPLGGGAE
jgi:hypothetical protein